MSDDVYVPLGFYLDQTIWPIDRFGNLSDGFLDNFAFEGGQLLSGDDGLRAGNIALRVAAEQTFDMPFGFALVLEEGPIRLDMTETTEGFVISMFADVLAFRLPRTLFVPAIADGAGFIADPDERHSVDIRIPVGLTVDQNFDLTFGFPADSEDDRGSLEDLIDATNGELDTTDPDPPLPDDGGIHFDPERFFLGETGFSVAVHDIAVRLFSGDPLPAAALSAGLDSSFRGVVLGELAVAFPPDLAGAVPPTLTFKDCFIGTGGFTGNATFTGSFSGTFLGSTFELTSLGVVFRQSALTKFELKGNLTILGFSPPLAVTIGLDLAGKLTVDVARTNGIAKLVKDPIMEIDIDRIGFDTDADGLALSLSGSLTPLYRKTEIAWPTLKVEKFRIDSHGDVSFGGGWVDLPKHASFSLFGFTIEVTKIGLGRRDDGRHWIGLSGGVKLVNGFQAGASVDGLRIAWNDNLPLTTNDIDLSLDGVGVELTIPDVISVKGSVSLKGEEFGGAVKVTVHPAQLTIGGQFVTGSVSPGGPKTFAIYLHAELPSGIPLGATGLAIYGMAGLYAENREPDKLPAEGWYQTPNGDKGWYLREPVGIENVVQKWRGSAGQRAFGAGVTIGTFGDNGFKFNGRLLLVLVFPGPRVLLEGKANLFKKRAALEDDPTFRALAVIEPGKSVLLSLDAHYQYKSTGELLDLRGSAEAFFGSNNDWHIILGFKDDPKRRIRARLFKLFDTSSYFELRPHRLDIGSGWSFDKSWGFSHLNVHLLASLDEAATVSWHPNHFTGTLNMQGKAELRAFGHGVGVGASAKITGDVFDPFHLNGKFHVGIDLPWPLPDVGATVELDWQRALVAIPPQPLPLKEVSAEWEPGLVTPPGERRWPFVRGTNLLPNFDQGGGEAAHGSPPGADAGPGVFANALLIPADAQVGLTFTRPVDDQNNIGNNPLPIVVPHELVGDPYKTPQSDGYRQSYALVSVTLEKIGGLAPAETAGAPLPPGLSAVGWVAVAAAPVTQPDAQQTTLFGSWQPSAPSDGPPDPAAPSAPISDPSVSTGVPSLAQSKLLLGAKTPLKYTAIASQSWDEWFTTAYPGYPCLPFDPNEKFVAVFDQPIGTNLGSNPGAYRFPGPVFDVRWREGGIVVAVAPVQGTEGSIDRGLAVGEFPLVDEPLTASDIEIGVPPGQNGVGIRVTRLPGLDTLPAGWGTFDPPSEGDSEIVSNPAFFSGVNAEFDGPGGSIELKVVGDLVGLVLPPGEAQIVFDTDVLQVDLSLVSSDTIDTNPTGAVRTVDEAGTQIGTTVGIVGGASQIRLPGPGIRRVIIDVELTSKPGSFLLTKVLARTPVVAVAKVEGASQSIGPFLEENGLVTVTSPGGAIQTIFLSTPTGGEFVIVELSIPSRRDEVIRHTVAALAQLDADDPVFEPDTHYRLEIATVRETTSLSGNVPATMKGQDPYLESIYFRTARLPGLGVPAKPAGDQSGLATTGFEDLSFYVTRTVPAVPPAEGGHASPARAFYRATDVNAEFSPDTIRIQSMYRLGKRDLTIRLFDTKNQPLRDVNGRIVLGATRWGRSDDPRVSAGASRWAGMVSLASCAPSPPPGGYPILNGEQVATRSSAPLAAETLHQARLVPMLLRESFEDVRTPQVADGQFQLDHWHAEPAGASWTVEGETVIDPGTGLPAVDPVTGLPLPMTFFAKVATTGETALVYHGPLASRDDVSRLDHPSQWTDFRASVQLRWDEGEIGLELRRGTAGLLRVVLDRTAGRRRLESVVAGQTQVLFVQADVSFPAAGVDVILTVDCMGDMVQIFQTLAGEELDEPVLVVPGVPTSPGGVALYVRGATAPRFTEVRVDDLRADPATAHRFDFITSRYVNFAHHLGGFDDRTFEPLHALTPEELGARVGVAFATPSTSDPALPMPAGDVPEAERRAFLELETLALGPGPLSAPERIEILRVAADTTMTALLVRSPEPIRWERTELVFGGTSGPATAVSPGALKLTAVAFSGGAANQEAVTILARDAKNATGYGVEWRPLPAAGQPEPEWTPYFTFGTEPSLAEGEQVRVCSGAPEALDHDVGVTLRFASADPATAVPQFPTTGVELRLLDPAGAVIHQRTFQPDGAFSLLATSVVRKGDGTAFFLWLPAAPEAIRLQLTFVRAPTATLPGMRQSGSVLPERVALDLPSR